MNRPALSYAGIVLGMTGILIGAFMAFTGITCFHLDDPVGGSIGLSIALGILMLGGGLVAIELSRRLASVSWRYTEPRLERKGG